MGCGNSSSTPGATTSNQSTTVSPPASVLTAYQNLINQGTAASQLPLQQYQGPTVAGFNPTQQTAFSEINRAQGSALPYLNAAQGEIAGGTTPIMSQVQGFDSLNEYQNPYTQQVTQTTQNLLNQQNAQQFNSANAAAASEGAFGGDREAVLEAQMAGQQQLTEAPELAQIQSQGFTGAEQELNTQQNLQLQGASATDWLQQNAAGMEANLGNEAQNSLLSGASAELQAGGLQQQLEQEQLNVPIEQFQQQQAWPYQTTNFLAGIVEGAGPGEGGTSTTTYPGPNELGTLAGLGIAGLGAYKALSGNSGTGNNSSGSSSYTPGVAHGVNYSAFYTQIARGGRIGFPSARRALGGYTPFPSAMGNGASTGMGNADAGDMADVNEALQLLNESPISSGSLGGTGSTGSGKTGNLNISTPNVGGGSGGSSSSSDPLASISQLMSMGASAMAMFANRGGGVPRRASGGVDPSMGPMGGTASLFSDLFGQQTGNLLAGASGDWLGFVNAADNPQLTQLVDPLQILRRGGRAGLPVAAQGGFPRAFDTGGDTGDDGTGSWYSNPLIAMGAAMMASKSPFFLSQLGEGLQAGLKDASSQKTGAPHVDDSGPYVRVIYPGRSPVPTRLPNINKSPPGDPWQSPVPDKPPTPVPVATTPPPSVQYAGVGSTSA